MTEKKSYKVYQFRLNDQTVSKLRKIKEKEGKTWNLTFFELINQYKKTNEKTNRRNYSRLYNIIFLAYFSSFYGC